MDPVANCILDAINRPGPDEADDDWVVVKKQKITVLIPPPSPPWHQIAKEIRHRSATNGISNANEKRAKRSHIDPKPSSSHFSSFGCFSAVKAVNRRIRAATLARRLRSFGGMKAWLALLGLGHITAMLERKKSSEYWLASLSERELKGMGMNAVGPRRKLLHAIDLLSQPYYIKSFTKY